MLIILLGCSIEFEEKGIQECKSPIANMPVYKFNSESDSTHLVIGIGAPTYLEFYDLNSNKFIKLYEDNLNYKCILIEGNKHEKAVLN